jgi:hypothetical protein
MYRKEVLFVKIGFFEKFPQYVIDEKQKKLELENFKAGQN